MRKICTYRFVLIALIIVMALVLLLVSKNLYSLWARSRGVSQEWLKHYQPSINLPLIEKATGLLRP